MSKSAEWDEIHSNRNRLMALANDLNELQLGILRTSWMVEDEKPMADVLVELRNIRTEVQNLSYLALRGLRGLS